MNGLWRSDETEMRALQRSRRYTSLGTGSTRGSAAKAAAWGVAGGRRGGRVGAVVVSATPPTITTMPSSVDSGDRLRRDEADATGERAGEHRDDRVDVGVRHDLARGEVGERVGERRERDALPKTIR